MPAVSKKQRKAAGIATAIQEGKIKAKPGTPAAEMARSMKPSDLKEFAGTPEKGLPQKVRPVRTMTVNNRVQKRKFPK